MKGTFLTRHFSKQEKLERITINNPFKTKSLDDIDKQSSAFAELVDNENGDIEWLRELFRKAGRISYNPPNWDEGVGIELSEYEKRVLEVERDKGFLYQTKPLKITVAVQWLSAIIQGWIQSTLNGADLTWYKKLGPPGTNPATQTSALWILAGTNATVFLVAAGACFLSDPLQSRLLGRRGVIFIGATLCFAASIGAACVDHWIQLLGCRVILGLAMGLKGPVTSIFAAEVSPCHLRGQIVMGWQAGDALGIFLGFTANLVVSYAVGFQYSWIWQTASVALPAFALMLLIWTIPDSPRLHLKRGQYPQAFKAMCQLRETPLQAARDLFYANAQLQMEANSKKNKVLSGVYLTDDERARNQGIECYQIRVRRLSWRNRVKALIVDRRTRRALQAALIVMIAQQLCGFNVLAFYSNNFFSFETFNKADNRPVWLSWGIGLCNFVCTLPAFYLIDRWGRVSLLLVTYPFMILFMLSTSITFGNAGDTIPKKPVEALAFFFTAAYSLGQGPVAFTYSAEVFPLVYREIGMSIAVAANFFGAGLLTLLVPLAQFAGSSAWANDSSCTESGRCPELKKYNTSQAWMLGAFVLLEVLALILIFLFVPETGRCITSEKDDLNHMSLEELNSIFEQPTFHHTNYRIQETVPHEWKRLMYKASGGKYHNPGHVLPMYRWDPKHSDDEDQANSDRSSPVHIEHAIPDPSLNGALGPYETSEQGHGHLHDGTTMPDR